MKFKIHRPPHYYFDETIYMITASTVNRLRLFTDDRKKMLLKDILRECLDCFNFTLYAWVILGNHYHLLVKSNQGRDLIQFVKKLHGKSAVNLNRIDHKIGRQVWYQYWDTCTRGDKDFWTRFNYIHHNPVKHGYVENAANYDFSSYNHYLSKYGQEWLDGCFSSYPTIDFTSKKTASR